MHLDGCKSERKVRNACPSLPKNAITMPTYGTQFLREVYVKTPNLQNVVCVINASRLNPVSNKRKLKKQVTQISLVENNCYE
jgi:hypothetical protein